MTDREKPTPEASEPERGGEPHDCAKQGFDWRRDKCRQCSNTDPEPAAVPPVEDVREKARILLDYCRPEPKLVPYLTENEVIELMVQFASLQSREAEQRIRELERKYNEAIDVIVEKGQLAAEALHAMEAAEKERDEAKAQLTEIATALNLPPEAVELPSCNHLAHVARQARENAETYFQEAVDIDGNWMTSLGSATGKPLALRKRDADSRDAVVREVIAQATTAEQALARAQESLKRLEMIIPHQHCATCNQYATEIRAANPQPQIKPQKDSK